MPSAPTFAAACATATVLLWLGAPAPDASVPVATAPALEPAAPDGGYDAAAARADVDTVLVDRGRGYLDARARLEAHPASAVPALQAKLESDALDPAQERRLHSILAQMGGPELAPQHAELLRASILANQGTAPWLDMLAATEPGRTQLTRLIGDRGLELDARANLLDALVRATPDPEKMVALVGHGHPRLGDQLWRSLIARGHADAAVAQRLRTSLDATIPGAEAPSIKAKLIALRAELAEPDDAEMADRLVTLADDAAQPFVVRFAAIRGLATQSDAAAHLGRIAKLHLGPAEQPNQSDVLLGWQALTGLLARDPNRATQLVSELDLERHPAPRISALAWRLVPMPAERDWPAWIDEAMRDPWPEVRAAGLSRVEGPCDRPTMKVLSTIAGPVSKGGTEDGSVARGAIGAIGRCGGPSARRTLEDLTIEDGIPIEQRGTAARELIERDPEGARFVAGALRSEPQAAMAETYANALGRTPADRVEPVVLDALCGTIERHPNAARAAKRALDDLSPDYGCP